MVGKRRVGKSTLIDALRSLSADDENSAKIKTSESNPVYPFLNEEKGLHLLLYETEQDNFTFHSEKEKTTYSAKCLLVINEDLDLQWLADQCLGNTKDFVVVRSKMNITVKNDAQEHPKTHHRDKLITSVRNSIKEQLETVNLSHLGIYLIDSHYPDRYDFKKLEEYLSQKSDTEAEVRRYFLTS